MGQRLEVEGVGGGTVRIGSNVLASIGGLRFNGRAADFSESLLEEDLLRLTEEVVVLLVDAGSGNPEITGGGSSRPSAALRES